MSNMSSYKRKRIENWVEEVALYLRNGTICRSVIGNVAEDAINGAAVGTSGAGPSENGENHGVDGESIHVRSYAGSGSLSQKIELALKKSTTTPFGADLYNSNNTITGGRSGSGDGAAGNAFPMVKFAYSHYHEQRRKIDRLVQGLPVLNAAMVGSSLDRPASRESTDEHAPIIFVNGEEPVRSRPTSQHRVSGFSSHYNNNNSSSANNNYHHYSQAHVATRNSHHHNAQLHAPHTARQFAQPFRSPGMGAFQYCNHHPHHHHLADDKIKNSGPDLRRSNTKNFNNNPSKKLHGVLDSRGSGAITVTIDPGLAPSSTSNDHAVARSKTAPTTNRNVHRARQRILTRRGNRVLEPSTQIPMQNCWAMAELSW